MKKVLLLLLLMIPVVSAFNISVETIMTKPDGTARAGTFKVNFTVRNSSHTVFTNTSNITTDNNGKFHKYFDIDYTGNATLEAKWNVTNGQGYDEETAWKQVGFVPYAVNALYLQGKDLDYFASVTAMDNGTIVRTTNASYILTSNATYVKTDNATYVKTDNATYVKTDNYTYLLVSNTSVVFNATDNDYYLIADNVSTTNITASDTGFITNIGSWARKVVVGWFTNIYADDISVSDTVNATAVNATYINTTYIGLRKVNDFVHNVTNPEDGAIPYYNGSGLNFNASLIGYSKEYDELTFNATYVLGDAITASNPRWMIDNSGSIGKIGIGTTPSSTIDIAHPTSGVAMIRLMNTNTTDTTSSAEVRVGISPTQDIRMIYYSRNYSQIPWLGAKARFTVGTDSDGLLIETPNTTRGANITFSIGAGYYGDSNHSMVIHNRGVDFKEKNATNIDKLEADIIYGDEGNITDVNISTLAVANNIYIGPDRWTDGDCKIQWRDTTLEMTKSTYMDQGYWVKTGGDTDWADEFMGLVKHVQINHNDNIGISRGSQIHLQLTSGTIGDGSHDLDMTPSYWKGTIDGGTVAGDLKNQFIIDTNSGTIDGDAVGVEIAGRSCSPDDATITGDKIMLRTEENYGSGCNDYDPDYGIYQNDGANNYFGSSIGVGTNAPTHITDTGNDGWIQDDWETGGNLSVLGDTYLADLLDVGGETRLRDNLIVDGNMSIKNQVQSGRDFTIKNTEAGNWTIDAEADDSDFVTFILKTGAEQHIKMGRDSFAGSDFESMRLGSSTNSEVHAQGNWEIGNPDGDYVEIDNRGDLNVTSGNVHVKGNITSDAGTEANIWGANYLHNQTYGMILYNDTDGVRVIVGDLTGYT